MLGMSVHFFSIFLSVVISLVHLIVLFLYDDIHVADKWQHYVLWNRCFVAIILSFSVAAWGLKKRSLDRSGAVAGIIIGVILTFGSYCFLTCLLVFFYTSSKATHFYEEKKKKLEHDYKEGGQRNWIQVICNGGTAAEFALLYILQGGAGECALEFQENFMRSWLSTAVLAALAGANGDTWASELGTVLTTEEPRLITSFKKVPIGTNGGISIIGIGASILGGAVVGLTYLVTLWFFKSYDKFLKQAVILIFVGSFAGLFGSLLDSVIGATLQYSGMDSRTGKIVDKPGSHVKHICGKPILDNHSVNMVMSVVNSVVVPAITAVIFPLIS